MSDFTPTHEQQAALEAFGTGGNVLLRAGAGTGKTSTLRLLAQSTSRRILFIAFNVTVKESAEKSFPSNVLALTSAGLANRGLRQSGNSKLLRKIGGPRQSPVDIAKLLGVPWELPIGEGMRGYQLSGIIMNTVRRFCYSADTTIERYHVPKIDGLDPEAQADLNVAVLPFARKAWLDLINPDGKLSWGKSHDYYFKFWALTNPVLDFDAIFVDEAQDTNPALAAVIANQSVQVVMVGDESQAIYGWRGARDAMASFNADHVVNLSQSFRFGPAVAEVANKFLALLDAPLRITGAGPESTVAALDEPDAILTRTNAGAIENAMVQLQAGRKVALVGSMAADIKRWVDAADKLMIGKPVTHEDLAAFKSWDEVIEYAQSDEGADLRVMVKLITTHGTQALRDCVDATTKPADADVIISTAHKAKGMEWNRVKIGADFKVATEDGNLPPAAELMLMYVAVTRAQITLDPGILALVGQE